MSDIIFTQQATGATPSSGKTGMFVKTDGLPYTKTSAGVEAQILVNGFPTIGTKETRVAMAASNIDLSAGNYFTKTISGNTTLTVSNVPASGVAESFILDITNGGSATITWWSGMKWANGAAPTLTAVGRDLLSFFTHDGGTTWNGLVLGKAMA